MRPYIDYEDLRFIPCAVDQSELVWHRDSEDREIEVLQGEGWRLQYNGSLPILLSPSNKYFIQKGLFHRLHKGATDLTLKIRKQQ